jgi:hypothetical protein
MQQIAARIKSIHLKYLGTTKCECGKNAKLVCDVLTHNGKLLISWRSEVMSDEVVRICFTHKK